MGIEIERKFLIELPDWKKFVEGIKPALIRQGYLNPDPERTVRVRMKDHEGYLTIKGRTRGISRSEFEYAIPPADASALLELCEGTNSDSGLIEKFRYTLTIEHQIWEVDEFFGQNAGLVIAEAELTSENDILTLPSWIGKEVTHDPRYYNSQLAALPYKKWAKN